MSPSDITVELLKQIRDGVYQTHERIDQTNQRLDQTNQRLDQTRVELLDKLDQTNDRLDQTRVELLDKIDQTNSRIDGTNARLSRLETSVSTLVGAVSTMADRDSRLEAGLDDLRRRVEVLEARTEP